MLEFIGGIAVGIVLGIVIGYGIGIFVVKKILKLTINEYSDIVGMAAECGNNREYTITAEYKNGNESMILKG